ncbi:efflux RND transporter permease subunit [Azospirillum sp. RWY-5-1]|uniref:Efflux RND transporter permease subunit n=1 Tax=Azospirillum oleiclasticum TaxID=2735135 RepID=A0ABX2TJ60_9PROT|nr:efflux RND transporter permease subunit [Azospirillum oleiclasticum]NYZ16474.1 efflux RND transporter permease subunit [Azospirillum oleiclasticum]NYZ24057.1 efflux RND transporter permease subunit [Azospirillum oleiclasticum]
MIRFFAGHPTAANVLMLTFFALGIMAVPTLLRETFPRIEPREVEVRVRYPGASPEDVERSVCRRIEDAIEGTDNVSEIACDSRDHLAIAKVEMVAGRDFDLFFSDIRTAIDGIDDFPDSAEEPVVTQLGRTEFVAAIVITGPDRATTLKALAQDVKTRMLRHGGIPKVDIVGFSDRQIRIEIPEVLARTLGLSLADIAAAVERQNIDLPVGEIKARDGIVRMRFTDQRLSVDAYRDIVVASSERGSQIRLGDIATITDLFEDAEVKTELDGRPAAVLNVSKTPEDDSLTVMGAIQDFLATERQQLPPTVSLSISRDVTSIIADRLDLLVTNAWQGLLLVFVTMWLFFGMRQAFWIAMGLPTSFLGAIAVMALLGYSINMLTMVGLLIVIGIVMDDAIVLSENIASHRALGKPPIQAAVDGAAEVGTGVIYSFMTTAAIFVPLAFLQGDLGELLRVIPVVMIVVLAFSIVEAFLILPNHLSHGGAPPAMRGPRKAAEDAVMWLRDRVVAPTTLAAVRWRYLTVGLCTFMFLATLALMAGGRVKFEAFPDLDGDVLEARIQLPPSATLADTEAAVSRVVAPLRTLAEGWKAGQPDGAEVVRSVLVTYNENADAGTTGPNLATVAVDLLNAEIRTVDNATILARWREALPGDIPAVRINLTEAVLGPAGRPLEFRLSGNDLGDLDRAADELKAWLGRYVGVVGVGDDLNPGKKELRIRLREGAGTLGLDSQAVASQIRAAYQGTIADEIQVGAESFEIEVRTASGDRDGLDDVDRFVVTTPAGGQVPLTAVAEITEARGFARINRIDRLPTVTVDGDVDAARANAADIVKDTVKRFLPDLRARHPGLEVSVEGATASAAETQASMMRGLLAGLVAVFLLLSFQFRSYAEPVAVMVVIPFALTGALLGHLVMGINFAMPSLLGVVSLAGIVVNGSILIIEFLKDNHDHDNPDVATAAARAAASRFRAILLTTTTTLAGLFPLLFETSLQAQTLIPLITSISFGLLSATVLITLVVPAFYGILDDLGLTSMAAERRSRAHGAPAPLQPAGVPQAPG